MFLFCWVCLCIFGLLVIYINIVLFGGVMGVVNWCFCCNLFVWYCNYDVCVVGEIGIRNDELEFGLSGLWVLDFIVWEKK